MSFINSIKGQFLDVIEYEDIHRKVITYKFQRPGGNNELKQGSQVIVREGQVAAFVKGGQLADILEPGTHALTTRNFPILSSLKAFPFMFNSPVVSDVYFISTRQMLDNKWATKTPIIKRDDEFGMIRLRAFGKFAFRIFSPEVFMKEVFGSLGYTLSYDIVTYLSSLVTEAFAVVLGELDMPVLDLATEYRKISRLIQDQVNETSSRLGVMFSEVIVESVSLPDEVEAMIDEQSGISMAKRDMEGFMQYQSARAMRDAAKQKGGLAGLGAGLGVGKVMAENIASDKKDSAQGKSRVEQLRELKELLDDGILTQEEFDEEKRKILG